MTTGIPDLFDLAERRLAWVDQRQAVLSQNVANANTPGYAARDVQPFATFLAAATPGLTVTDPMHLPGTGAAAGSLQPRPRERAPDGNAVSMEEELTKVADTAGIQSLTLNLYHKYSGLFRLALGK